MDDNEDFTNQAIDLIFKNETIKKRLSPWVLTGVSFNLILLLLLGYLVYQMHLIIRILY